MQPQKSIETIFDIGMYDGADSRYYLDEGYKVIAVEANDTLVNAAEKQFADAVSSGRFIILNGAIAERTETVELNICGEDLASSSISSERVADRRPAGQLTINAFPITDLLERYGVPHYMKVDIEGFDRYCILPLTSQTAPMFVSFEMGADAEELIEHLSSIGYRHFKIISQMRFRELDNVNCFSDRVSRRLCRIFGRPESKYVRKAGRVFRSGHSSGPLPQRSDGKWYPLKETLNRWRTHCAAPRFGGWWDLHARR